MLWLPGLLSDAVQHQHVDATSSTVLHLISNHLKMAPHRQGGAGKGCHVPAREHAEKSVDSNDKDGFNVELVADNVSDSDAGDIDTSEASDIEN